MRKIWCKKSKKNNKEKPVSMHIIHTERNSWKRKSVQKIDDFIETLKTTRKEISEHSEYQSAETDLIVLTAISKDFTDDLFDILGEYGEEEIEHYEKFVDKIRHIHSLIL